MENNEEYTFEVTGYTVAMTEEVKRRVDALKRIKDIGPTNAEKAGFTPVKLAQQVKAFEAELHVAIDNEYDGDTATYLKQMLPSEVLLNMDDFLNNRVRGKFPLDILS
jgi:recombinational DNA repair protein RecR